MECRPELHYRSPAVTKRVTRSTTGDRIWEVIDGHPESEVVCQNVLHCVTKTWERLGQTLAGAYDAPQTPSSAVDMVDIRG